MLDPHGWTVTVGYFDEFNKKLWMATKQLTKILVFATVISTAFSTFVFSTFFLHFIIFTCRREYNTTCGVVISKPFA